MGFSREMTLLLVIPIAFSYVFLSGYKGVVVSNLIQMTVYFLRVTLPSLVDPLAFWRTRRFRA